MLMRVLTIPPPFLNIPPKAPLTKEMRLFWKNLKKIKVLLLESMEDN